MGLDKRQIGEEKIELPTAENKKYCFRGLLHCHKKWFYEIFLSQTNYWDTVLYLPLLRKRH